MILALAGGDPICLEDLFPDITDSFFSPKTDFLRYELSLCVLESKALFSSKLYMLERRSEPARSTIFKNDYIGLPNLLCVLILIWKTWWLRDECGLIPLFLNTRFFDDRSIWSRNS